MLISALCEYYDDLARDGKVVPEGYSEQAVDFLVALAPNGKIESIIDWRLTEQVPMKSGRMKERKTSRTVLLPKRTEKQKQKVNELLKNLDKSKQTVVISPATTWGNKHWNKDNWREVVNYLDDKVNLIFTGGPNDNELINYISQGKGLNLAGKTDIIELAEVFSRANLVISPDSGSAHLAWATRNPKVIAIFTCTPKEVLGPLGSYDKYVSLGGRGLNCQPCFKRKCLCKDNFEACTHIPGPQEVTQTIDRLIFS